MKLTYVNGDATKPVGKGKKLVLHIANDENLWNSGFVLAVNQLSPRPVDEYHRWYNEFPKYGPMETGPFKLGQAQFIHVEQNIIVVNMIAQSTPGGYNGFPPIRYQSLEECLMRVREKVVAYQKRGGVVSLHGPRFGSERAGGSWPEIEKIINRVFKDVDVDFTIYDFK